MRDLATVIQSIAAELPESEADILRRLDGLKHRLASSPAEMLQSRWHDLDMIIIDLMGPRWGAPFPTWLEKAIAVYKGE